MHTLVCTADRMGTILFFFKPISENPGRGAEVRTLYWILIWHVVEGSFIVFLTCFDNHGSKCSFIKHAIKKENYLLLAYLLQYKTSNQNKFIVTGETKLERAHRWAILGYLPSLQMGKRKLGEES